jgi:hypothetical protein
MSLSRKIKQKNHNKKHNTPDFNESDELKEIVKGANEDVPMDENIGDPFTAVIPRSNFAYNHLYENGEIKLKHKHEKDNNENE